MFMGASFNPLMIVTDLMQGDLEHLLLDRSVHLSLLTRLEMAKDAALGLNWLHCSTPMIIHRDVVRCFCLFFPTNAGSFALTIVVVYCQKKTSNFLYDENLRIVVSDFGFAEYLRPGASTWDESGSFKGTLYYVAPEMLKNSEFNEKSDVYSFGIVLWMIYTRQEVYQELEAEYHDLNEHAFDAKVRPVMCLGESVTYLCQFWYRSNNWFVLRIIDLRSQKAVPYY
jgi:serine/threonine protein kinase